MPDVLGVVLTAGRGGLAEGSLGDVPLSVLAVELLTPLCDGPIVVVAQRQPLVGEQLAGHSASIDLCEWPGDSAWVRETLDAAARVVVHDVLCPLVPPDFVRGLLSTAETGRAVAAIRPVVDTLKATSGGFVAQTVDRETLCIVTSPLVSPGSLLAAVDDLGSAVRDPGSLVRQLRKQTDVALVPAPDTTRRIADSADLDLLAVVRRRGQPGGPGG